MSALTAAKGDGQHTTTLDRIFRLRENRTDVRTEVLAGATTFVTLAYILFVNPNILKDAGMPVEATFAATCVASAFATLVMGLYANYPIAVAPRNGPERVLHLCGGDRHAPAVADG